MDKLGIIIEIVKNGYVIEFNKEKYVAKKIYDVKDCIEEIVSEIERLQKQRIDAFERAEQS